MKTFGRECSICCEAPGECLTCAGTGILGKKQVRPRTIGIDKFGRKFHGFNAFGPTYAKPRISSERCTLCRGTGRCYRCKGAGVVVSASPHTTENGRVRTLQLILRDNHWEQYFPNHTWLHSLPADLTSGRVRMKAAELISLLDDRDLEALEIFEGRSGRKGWELENFRDQLRQVVSNLEESENLVGILEETGLVTVVARKDAQGHFVSIEPGQSDEAQLIRAIVSDSDWAFDKP